MERWTTDSKEFRELVEVVGKVRQRWRTKLAMRGLAVAAIIFVLAFFGSIYAIGEYHFAPVAILTARITLAVLFVGLMIGLVLLPLWKRVSDDQVALYLEEKEPSLRSVLISSLDAGRATDGVSPALARRTIETAVARVRSIEAGKKVERKSLSRSGATVLAAALAALLVFALSPDLMKESARALFMGLRSAEAAGAMRVSIQPGDASIPRGADLPISAELVGFAAQEAVLYVRLEGDAEYERMPMIPREDRSGFELRLFNLATPAEYYVEAQGVQSPVYAVEVLDLPYVDRLEMELIFPEYTGMEPQLYEDGGDVYAPEGTRVRIRAVPTMPITGGRITLSEGGEVALSLQPDGSLGGEFTVETPGLYQVEMEATGRRRSAASPEYLIEIMDDAAPRVVFDKPGRDIKVTLTDEVYLEAHATDDFGVQSLELVYSVNGGAEQVVPLYQARPMTEVSAGHTFYLEELDLQAGDFIAYHARTVDVGPLPRKTISSDMYFVEVLSLIHI